VWPKGETKWTSRQRLSWGLLRSRASATPSAAGFGSEGYHVYVAGRTEAKIAKVVETIAKAGGSAEAVTTDATARA
jgi:hypothetical protein